jgi:microcin C transport system substrate-binding protein
MDNYDYDMTWAAWGAGLFKDPESMWHSKEAERPSGNNVTGFKHAEVDALIDRQREIFDVQRAERHLPADRLPS